MKVTSSPRWVRLSTHEPEFMTVRNKQQVLVESITETKIISSIHLDGADSRTKKRVVELVSVLTNREVSFQNNWYFGDRVAQ